MNKDEPSLVGKFYDEFDYKKYWQKRNYEDLSGKIALKSLLDKINFKSKKKLLEIGAGYGRLANIYGKLFKHSVLLDPSQVNLSQAEKKFGINSYTYIKGSGIDLPFRDRSFDVVLLVRVIHHLFKPTTVFQEIFRVLKPGGWFILEFANKRHFKSKMFFKEKAQSLEPVDISQQKSILPFKNYHPLWIENKLREIGFQPKNKLSVSNLRSPMIKKIMPDNILISLEKICQRPLGKLNFGPSIFVLAKKASA
jgi:ubiquinone/menaquinone biosynthesis C-methylase UbiE